uniref:CCHC-type domain-containing protein n=1 Tax=Quercus lobata TaxID=97700 RepID=A0A7N2LRF7_QUELO
MQLTTEEDEAMTVRSLRRQEILEEYSLSLIGKFLTARPINFRVVKNLIRSMWKLEDDLKIVDVGDGLLQFKFSMESQMQWVWNNGPWCFDNQLLALRRWEKGITVRVRVELPLDKPLRRRGPVVSPEGDKVRGAFRYERLVGWCYACGKIGHEVKECRTASVEEKESRPYGDWMKAGSRVRVREMELIKSELGFPSMLAVSSEGCRGGLALLWNSEVVVDTQTSEEKYGRHPRPLPPMVEFRNTLLHCGLIELGFSGYPYTWRNGRPNEAFVEEMLDRACATLGWSELFLTAKVIHLTVSYSDHDPLLLDTAPSTLNHHRQRRLQRHRVAQCRLDLVAWSRIAFGNTRDCLDRKQKELEELVENGYGLNMDTINGLKKEINDLLHHEEVFWRQQSRSIWLPTGDKNTRFFHQRASQRRRKNNIDGLHDREGTWQTGLDGVSRIAEEYYTELFTSTNPNNMDRVLNVVDKVVTDHMANSLTQLYIEEDVRVVLFQTHPSKAPGLNGMSPLFFQKY